MIRRRYSPPFQAPAPQLGVDDLGNAVKGLVSVEVSRSNEISFAVESFGCDGKPVLSMLRGLSCEADGKPVMVGTKNGMPFKLGSELPRGVGSAIRGAGGGLVQVDGGVAMRSTENVLYDNYGNYWSLDQIVGSAPTYLGQTPPYSNGDGVTPGLCVQDPKIRPYELRWEYPNVGGDPPEVNIAYYKADVGWQQDGQNPLITYPVAYPYVAPTDYWRIEQWVPDETTAPPGGEFAGSWPGILRRLQVTWYPARADVPHDWDAITQNSTDIIVSKYPVEAPWTVIHNQFTRPLLEHITLGATNDETPFILCVERDQINSPYPYRLAMRSRATGALLSYLASPVNARNFLTPDATEGWLVQGGAISGSTVTVRRYLSRANTSAAYGSALTANGTYAVTLPSGAAAEWTAEPVWFRVGTVTRTFGRSPRLSPRLPKWS